MNDAALPRLFGEQCTKVDATRSNGVPPGQLAIDVRTHLVMPSRNGRSQVNTHFIRRRTRRGHRVQASVKHTVHHSAPSGVHKADNAGRMRQKYRHAIGHRDRERCPPCGGHVPVGAVDPAPASPVPAVGQNPATVNLPGGGEPLGRSELLEHTLPAAADIGRRSFGGNAEVARVACGREREYTQLRELLDDFAFSRRGHAPLAYSAR